MNSRYRIPFFIIIMLILAGCGQEQHQKRTGTQKGRVGSVSVDSRRAPGSLYRFASDNSGKKDIKNAPRPFLPPAMDAAAGRQLEYRVSLTIKVTNLILTREQLLKIIPKYGFLRSSSWNSRYRRPSLSIAMRIDSRKLLAALTEIAATGTLIRERITVTDHTEDMFINTVRAARSALRINRNRFRQGTDTQRNNYRADEDASDNQKIAKWRINDRVRWATVNLYCQGPEKPARVQVPSLRNTLVNSLNSLLTFLVELIPAIPFLLLGLWIWFKRKRIKAFFTRSNKNEQQD